MSGQNPIRVMVVDDHPTLREGLATLIECYSDLEIVGQAAEGREALHLCDQLRPDVILMDLIMPNLDGPTAMAAIHGCFPEIRLIAFSSSSEVRVVRAALQAGASAYLLKTMELDDLASAIRRVQAGELVLAPEVSRILIQTVVQPPPALPVLTPREQQVLEQMVLGCSNVQIAEELGVKPETIRTHVSNILAKLGAKNRVQAVLLATQHHWLPG